MHFTNSLDGHSKRRERVTQDRKIQRVKLIPKPFFFKKQVRSELLARLTKVYISQTGKSKRLVNRINYLDENGYSQKYTQNELIYENYTYGYEGILSRHSNYTIRKC